MSPPGSIARAVWPLPAALTLLMFTIVRINGSRPDSFVDIVAVRCAGQMLNAGSDPYSRMRAICGPGTLDFFYPPMVARFAAATLGWLGISTWMMVFDIAYTISFATLILVAFRALLPRYGNLAALLAVLGLLLLLGGGVSITGFRSGNIAVIFWAAVCVAVLEMRSARIAALVIVVGACVKIYLAYLLVIPALMRRDLRLPIVAGCAVLLAYLAQWRFEPDLFAQYSHELRELSQTPGYAGASSMQLGVWTATLTGVPVMRLVVVAAIFFTLLWRSRYLIRLLLAQAGHQDAVQLRLLALLLLALTALSPRVTHYDMLVLLPVIAVLAPLPSQRIAITAGCIVIPWLFRFALIGARFDPLRTWLQSTYDLNYDTLWNFYMFSTWCAITGYAWFALGRKSIGAIVTQGVELPANSGCQG